MATTSRIGIQPMETSVNIRKSGKKHVSAQLQHVYGTHSEHICTGNEGRSLAEFLLRGAKSSRDPITILEAGPSTYPPQFESTVQVKIAKGKGEMKVIIVNFDLASHASSFPSPTLDPLFTCDPSGFTRKVPTRQYLLKRGSLHHVQLQTRPNHRRRIL